MSVRAMTAGLLLAACSAGVSPSSPSFAPDPETEPLPSATKGHIPDPRSPAPPKPLASSSVEPEMSAPSGPSSPSAGPAAGPSAAPPAKPIAKAAPAPAPAAPADCGSKDNPCPMQKLMRGLGAAATPEALEAAFNRVAGLSPNAGWQWAAIAKKGAELAKSGDTATAKKQCKACHDQYRDAYKAQYRARKL